MLAALAIACIASTAAAQSSPGPLAASGSDNVNAGEAARPETRLHCRRYFGCLSAGQLRSRTDIKRTHNEPH